MPSQPSESGADARAAPGRFPPRVWESAAERAIREAQERGEFDNLPGAGRPLQAEPWEGEWDMAHHVLKQAGYTLPWIELGKEIEQRRADLAAWLERTAGCLEGRRGQPGWADEWLAARTRYLERAADLDRLMVEFAFIVPVRRLEKGRLPPRVAEDRFDAACPRPH